MFNITLALASYHMVRKRKIQRMERPCFEDSETLFPQTVLLVVAEGEKKVAPKIQKEIL